MQTRSIRGSGEPACVNASLNACFRLGPDPRIALWPAASPPHKQAGHMTAPDQCCSNSESSCQGGRGYLRGSRPTHDALCSAKVPRTAGDPSPPSDTPAKLVNQIRGILAEHGIVIARDIWRLRRALAE